MTLPAKLPYTLERTVTIQATPATVFRFFTDSGRWAQWWGAGSTIDARPGGALYIRHPNAVEAGGEVLEVHAPDRIVFTYGFASGNPIPVGASRVTITLSRDPRGTRMQLVHELADEATRIEHVQGWRFQLSLFGNIVTNEVNANAAAAVDAWFSAWADPDAGARAKTLAAIAGPYVTFRDRYSNLESLDDVMAHITAAQMFMPGVRLTRAGEVRHCQGTVLADWVMAGPDGKELMKGTNVFSMGPTGIIEMVVGVSG